ncbi:hypothetical protein ACLOJK_024228, partial [Asimina triloba]
RALLDGRTKDERTDEDAADQVGHRLGFGSMLSAGRREEDGALGQVRAVTCRWVAGHGACCPIIQSWVACGQQGKKQSTSLMEIVACCGPPLQMDWSCWLWAAMEAPWGDGGAPYYGAP